MDEPGTCGVSWLLPSNNKLWSLWPAGFELVWSPILGAPENDPPKNAVLKKKLFIFKKNLYGYP